LEEVKSVIIEEKPRKGEHSNLDSDLVQFFGFVNKKLANNTEGLQKLFK